MSQCALKIIFMARKPIVLSLIANLHYRYLLLEVIKWLIIYTLMSDVAVEPA